MTRRFPLVPTLVVIAAVALLISLGVWQLHRAKWKEQLLARYAAAEKLPPTTWPTIPLHEDQLPLFRHATGVCLRVVGWRAVVGENAAGEPGYSHVADCSTGAEGPGMSVDVGWSKEPNQRIRWPGGPVSGVIVPDRKTRMRLVAATAAPGLEPTAPPAPTSAISPARHRGYAATWFALAGLAFLIYVLALRKKWREERRKA